MLWLKAVVQAIDWCKFNALKWKDIVNCIEQAQNSQIGVSVLTDTRCFWFRDKFYQAFPFLGDSAESKEILTVKL